PFEQVGPLVLIQFLQARNLAPREGGGRNNDRGETRFAADVSETDFVRAFTDNDALQHRSGLEMQDVVLPIVPSPGGGTERNEDPKGQHEPAAVWAGLGARHRRNLRLLFRDGTITSQLY